MKMKDLPLRLMHTETSNPRQQLLDRLDELQVTAYITRKYQSLEDIADAFDGAFTATQIELHLKHGAPKKDWYIEVLGWYDQHHKDIVKSPFYDGLRTALHAMDLGEFYEEAIDFVIENKGQL